MAKSEVWAKAGKTRNLTEKQVKQGQRAIGGGRSERLKKGEGAAAMNAVKISDTKWMSKGERGGKGRGGLLVDASGKAVTGTVTLASGAKASYVRGKRVTTAGPKAAAPARMGRGGGGGGGGNKPPAAPPRRTGTMESPGGGSARASFPASSSRTSPKKRGEGSGQIAKRSYGGNLPGDREMKNRETWSYTDSKGRTRRFRKDYEHYLVTGKPYYSQTEWA